MLSPKQIKKFRKCATHLKKHISTTLPVRIYLVNDDLAYDASCAGLCYKSKKSIIIQIHDRSSTEAVDALIHEFAHAYLIDIKNHYDHSQEWGKMYAKCYNLVWKIWEEK